MFGVVMLWLLCDAHGLGKEPRVVGEVEGAGQPCWRMLVMLPRGPVWPALMWTISGVVEVARVAGGGKLRDAFCTRLGMVMQWY